MKRIIHISDIHVGAHIEHVLEKAISSINEYNPDLVIFTGDLTHDAQIDQFQEARDILKGIESDIFMVPGNHDYHYMGFIMYHKFFGKPGVFKLQLDDTEFHLKGFNSCLPDLSYGRLSGNNFKKLKRFLDKTDRTTLTGVAFHHHLVPPPFCGIEKSLLYNAGDVLEQLLDLGANMFFSGHRHVPNLVTVDDLLVMNAGTPSKKKLRGWVPRNYTVLDIEENRYDVYIHTVEEEKKLFYASFKGVFDKDDEGEESYVLKRVKRNSLSDLFPVP